MSEVKGKLITCNRCDETLFLKFLEHVDMDGGFSQGYNKYEDLPEDWLYESELGHLCPNCARDFRMFVTSFMGGKVPQKWKYITPEEG